MMDWLTHLPTWVVVLVLGLSVLVESGFIFGLVLPGTTAMLSMGVMIGLGTVPAPLGYLVASAAAASGASLGWRSGHTKGPGLRTSKVGHWVGEARWEMADDILHRRGTPAIALAQFVIVARTLVPRLVGMGGRPYQRFAIVSIPAATGWACLLTGIGHFGGASLDAVGDRLGNAAVAAAVLAGLVFALAMAGQVVASNPQWGHGPLARATSLPFQRMRHAVDGTAERVASGRVAPVVAGIVWFAVTVIISVVSIVLVEFAVRHAGVAALDDWVEHYVLTHTSRDFDRAARMLSSQVLIFIVLFAFYVTTLFVLIWGRRRVSVEARLRLLTTTFGITALAYATGYFDDTPIIHSPDPVFFAHRFDAQVAIVPTALALAVVVASPWLVRRARITAWTGVAIAGILLAASHVVTGHASFSQIVTGLAVSVMWSILLAAAIKPASGDEDAGGEGAPDEDAAGGEEATRTEGAPDEDAAGGATADNVNAAGGAAETAAEASSARRGDGDSSGPVVGDTE